MLGTVFFRGLALALVMTVSTTATAEIVWREDLQKAHAEATQTGKPLLLHFYGDNCPWCDKLEVGAFKSAEVADAIEKGFVPVKVHTGRNQNLVQMFKVRQIPTDVVVTPNGQVISHGTSKQSSKDFVAVLSQSLQSLRNSNTAVAATQPTATTTAPTQQVAAAPTAAPVNAPVAPNAPAALAPAGTAMASVENAVNQAPVTPAPVAPTQRATAQSYAMPGGFDGKTPGQLVGSRTDNMSLAPPVATTQGTAAATSNPNTANASAAPASQPELALEGFCPVTIVAERRWQEGKPELGVIHLGRLYLFADQKAMETFLADPVPYTPMLNEIDVVRFFADRVIVPGKRTHGTVINNRMFFFQDEAALEHFNAEWQRYFDAAVNVMNAAIQESNPRS